MEHVDDVAAAFVELLGPMPAMKLEKLVYYAQAWNVAHGHGRLFANSVEAWAKGPVIDHLFQQHKNRRTVDAWPMGDPARLGARARETVMLVVGLYGHMTGDELSELTHAEAPWVKAREGLSDGARSRREIPIAMMNAYYGGQVLASGKAIMHARANAAIEGLAPDPAFEETLAHLAEGSRTPREVVEELVTAYSTRG